jgi:hypothetical protein
MTILHTTSWLAGNKGKHLLVLDVFVFQSNKISAKATYWKCEVKECEATAHTDSNDQLIKKKENTHIYHHPHALDLEEYLEGLSLLVAKNDKGQ